MATLRIPFVENRGQHDGRVLYSADTFAGSVFVTHDGALVHSFRAGNDAADPGPSGGASPVTPSQRGWTLVETLEGARTLAPSGSQPAAARISRFIGSDSDKWQRNLATFNRVEIGEAWDGIDVAVQAHGDNVEKLFTVKPGADAESIRVRIDGAESLRIGPDGSLIAATPDGEIAFTAPVAFQERDGMRSHVQVAYALQGGVYGFTLGEHDAALPVVIDPLLQSTYLGGSGADFGGSIAIDAASGDVYVGASSNSSDFPGASGGAQPDNGGDTDFVIARVSADLGTLLQTTYLGGSGDEGGTSLALAAAGGDVLVAGASASTNFPGVAGGAQEINRGGSADIPTDFVVARLSGDLTTLRRSTYLGGSGPDYGAELAIHPHSGEVYVAGSSASIDWPGTVGGAQPSFVGVNDLFIARLSADLTRLLQSTYFGGSNAQPGSGGNESLGGLAIHPDSGEVYVTMQTDSLDLPGTAGGAQEEQADLIHDGAVARLSADLTQLLQATYLGGTQIEGATGLAIHPGTGEVYVQVQTSSTDFPGAAGGAQDTYGGGTSDTLIARLNADLTILYQSTYLGDAGGALYSRRGLAIHPTSGEVYVVSELSYAFSESEPSFPGTAGGVQTLPGSIDDLVISRLSSDLKALLQSTYLGGVGHETDAALSIDPGTGSVYLAGWSTSSNFPGTAGGAQEAYAGGVDMFIARLPADLAGLDTAPEAFSFTDRSNVPLGAVQVSDSIEVQGIEAPAAIQVTGGEYSVNGAAFTSADGAANEGDRVRLRHTSSTNYSTAVDSTINIGGVIDTWTTTTLAFADSDGDGITDDADTDDDNDGLPDGQDQDPLSPDADGDGIADGKDVEFIQRLIASLPLGTFRQPQQGNRNAMQSALNQVETLIAAGKKASAITKLQDLRKRVDGCGTVAQKDDWIMDCAAQLQVRALIDLLIANLRG